MFYVQREFKIWDNGEKMEEIRKKNIVHVLVLFIKIKIQK